MSDRRAILLGLGRVVEHAAGEALKEVGIEAARRLVRHASRRLGLDAEDTPAAVEIEVPSEDPREERTWN